MRERLFPCQAFRQSYEFGLGFVWLPKYPAIVQQTQDLPVG